MTVGSILAMGGGGFSMEPDNPLLDDYLLSLVPSGRTPARVCFVPTASGDSEEYVGRFEQAFAGRAETSVLSLFRREHRDLRAHVLGQDVVYVGGGNTANLLALWRLHGLDDIFAEALAAGVVLAGVSAGMNCWFEGCVTEAISRPAMRRTTAVPCSSAAVTSWTSCRRGRAPVRFRSSGRRTVSARSRSTPLLGARRGRRVERSSRPDRIVREVSVASG